MEPDTFFDYACDACGTPVCERVTLMGLSLGYEEATLCPACLAREEGMEEAQVVAATRGYIQSRDCFRKPWARFDASGCPRLATHTCPCQDPPTNLKL